MMLIFLLLPAVEELGEGCSQAVTTGRPQKLRLEAGGQFLKEQEMV